MIQFKCDNCRKVIESSQQLCACGYDNFSRRMVIEEEEDLLDSKGKPLRLAIKWGAIGVLLLILFYSGLQILVGDFIWLIAPLPILMLICFFWYQNTDNLRDDEEAHSWSIVRWAKGLR